MRNGNLLFSAVQFLIVAVLFGIGGVLLGLHYLPHVRQEIAQWFLESNGNFLFLGYLVLAAALLLSICFWIMQKGHYLRLQMGGKAYSIDEALLRQAIGQFWRQEFPKTAPPSEIYFAHQKIELVAREVECDLKELEARLAIFLSQKFGYEKDFFVTLSAKNFQA